MSKNYDYNLNFMVDYCDCDLNVCHRANVGAIVRQAVRSSWRHSGSLFRTEGRFFCTKIGAFSYKRTVPLYEIEVSG